MNNSTWSNLRRLLKYVRPLMTYLISMAALIAIQAGLTMLDPMYLGRIVDLVLNQQFAMKTLWTLVTIYLAIVISRVLLEIGVNWLDTLFTTKLTFTLRSRILEGILGQDQTFWGHRYTPGDLLTRGTDDVAMVERFMSHSA
ncbi:MAG: ABC transporter transmembrane domain-containing protein, partial [Bacillota bacterium]